MKKAIGVLVLGFLGLLVLAGCEDPVVPKPAEEPPKRVEYETGLVLMDVEAYQSVPVLRADSVGVLPRSVDLSVDVPLPGNQGMQGSCVGWAVAYALKSYHERIERGWVLNDHRHVMSPAYLYNQIKVPGPGGGAYIPDAFEVLMEQGVSSWSLMPYSQYDDDIQPSAAARAEAADYKIAEWGAVLRSGDFVGELKRHLADGSPIVLAIPVYSDFLQLGNDNRIYDDSGGALYGYHAVTVVGYDDAWSAFEIINSWGTGWGLRGYGWIDYDAVSWAILEAYVARDVLELPDDEPPEAVSDPSPANGAAGVAVDTPLSWTRNARTTSFDVYLGLTPTLTATDLQSTVALPTFSPTLARGATYYWRVDANGAGGTTAGPVWSFTTVEPEPPPDPPEPEPDPPVIIKHPAPITFSSPSAAAQTRTLSDYIRGATSYEVQASPAGIVTTRVAGHTLNVTPAAVGAATVRIQGTNGDGSSPWLSMNVTVTAPPRPEPPTILRALKAMTFASPAAAAQTVRLTRHVSGATNYHATATPADVVQSTITGDRLTVTPLVAGSAVLTVTARNANGAVNLSTTALVNEPPPPPPAVPELSIADARIDEGDNGIRWIAFRLSLSEATSRRVSARVRTVDGTAVAGSDYIGEDVEVHYLPGATGETTFNVRVYGDTQVEQDEWFRVVVEQVENATLVDGTAIGTIVNDDAESLPVPPGTTWRAFDSGATLHGLTWDGTRFVAVGRPGHVVHSVDGTIWKSANSNSPYLFGVTWGQSRFVAVGDGGTFYSPDSVSWTRASSPSVGSVYDVEWDGTRFIAVGGTITYSVDGISWSTASGVPSPALFYDVAWNGIRHVVVGDAALYSGDGGASWSVTNGAPLRLLGVTWGGSRFVAVGILGLIMHSSDGVTWSRVVNSGTNKDLLDVEWSGERFVAVGDGGTVLHSVDGISWSAVEGITSVYLQAIEWNGRQFVAVSSNGAVLVSP